MCFALGLVVALVAGVQGDVTQVTVTTRSHGCSGPFLQEEVLVRGGEGSFIGDAGRHVSALLVEQVARALLETAALPSDLLEQAGITRESVVAHRADILAAAVPEAWRKARPLDEEALRPVFDPEKLLSSLRDEMMHRGRGPSDAVKTDIRFEGSTSVSMKASAPGITPRHVTWTVEAAGRSWQVIESLLPQELRRLVRPGSVAEAFLERGYWSERLWQDPYVWEIVVGRPLDELYAKRALLESQGEGPARSQLLVEKARSSLPGGVPYVVADLTLVGSALLDTLHLEVLLNEGKAELDWEAVLGFVSEAEVAVGKRPWLEQWAAQDGHRVVLDLCVVGDTLRVPNDDPTSPMAWKRAGLEGNPFRFDLHEEGGYRATGLASSAAAETLLVAVRGWGCDPFFDGLDFLYHPRGDPYALVDEHGNVTRGH